MKTLWGGPGVFSPGLPLPCFLPVPSPAVHCPARWGSWLRFLGGLDPVPRAAIVHLLSRPLLPRKWPS